jgi:Spy/CpxP family protein refolding chaperone
MNKRISGRILLPLVIGALALGLAGAAVAHERGKCGSPADRAAACLTEELSLTADQQAQVKKIVDEGFAKRTELREKTRQDMETLRKQCDENVNKVLTPEQQKKFEKICGERCGKASRWDCGSGRDCGKDRGCGKDRDCGKERDCGKNRDCDKGRDRHCGCEND